MTYVYGNKNVEGGVKCSPIHKTAIKGAKLVYTDDSEIKSNYDAIGVEVKPLTETKKRRTKSTKE